MHALIRQDSRVVEISGRAQRQKRSLFLATILLVVMAILAPEGGAQVAIISAAAAVVSMMIFFSFVWWRQDNQTQYEAYAMSNFIAEDVIPSFITDWDGEVLFTNKSARHRCGGTVSDTLGATLKQTFANPTPIMTRLRSAVDATGAAREEIVTRKGHVRLSVHRMGAKHLIWRLEDIQEKNQNTRSTTPMLPMLMLGRGEAILSMNDPARRLIGQRVKKLDRIFNRLPLVSGETTEIITENGPIAVMTCELDAGVGRRSLYLLPAVAKSNAVGWQSIEELPVPLLQVTPEGDVLTFNDSARVLVGDELREGVVLSDLMEGLGRSIRDWLRDTIDGRAGQNSEFLRLRRSDKEVFVQVTLNPVETKDGPGLIAVLNDATELKTLEAQFVQSQKMQALSLIHI